MMNTKTTNQEHIYTMTIFIICIAVAAVNDCRDSLAWYVCFLLEMRSRWARDESLRQTISTTFHLGICAQQQRSILNSFGFCEFLLLFLCIDTALHSTLHIPNTQTHLQSMKHGQGHIIHTYSSQKQTCFVDYRCRSSASTILRFELMDLHRASLSVCCFWSPLPTFLAG